MQRIVPFVMLINLALKNVQAARKKNNSKLHYLFSNLQTISISKALSGVEMPLKVKHARVAIIGTFHSRGAHSFWAVALRQPLQVCD